MGVMPTDEVTKYPRSKECKFNDLIYMKRFSSTLFWLPPLSGDAILHPACLQIGSRTFAHLEPCSLTSDKSREIVCRYESTNSVVKSTQKARLVLVKSSTVETSEFRYGAILRLSVPGLKT